MKIAVAFTVEIDAAEYGHEYGINTNAVREDVKARIENWVHEQFIVLGYDTTITSK